MGKNRYLNRLVIATSAVATLLGGYFLANALFLESREGGGSQQVLFAVASFTLAAALFGLHYQRSSHEPSWRVTSGQLLRAVAVGFIVLVIVMVASVNVRLLLCTVPLIAAGLPALIVVVVTRKWQRLSASQRNG